MSNLHRVHETYLARVLLKTFILFHLHVETTGVKCHHIVWFWLRWPHKSGFHRNRETFSNENQLPFILVQTWVPQTCNINLGLSEFLKHKGIWKCWYKAQKTASPKNGIYKACSSYLRPSFCLCLPHQQFCVTQFAYVRNNDPHPCCTAHMKWWFQPLISHLQCLFLHWVSSPRM